MKDSGKSATASLEPTMGFFLGGGDQVLEERSMKSFITPHLFVP